MAQDDICSPKTKCRCVYNSLWEQLLAGAGSPNIDHTISKSMRITRGNANSSLSYIVKPKDLAKNTIELKIVMNEKNCEYV